MGYSGFGMTADDILCWIREPQDVNNISILIINRKNLGRIASRFIIKSKYDIIMNHGLIL